VDGRQTRIPRASAIFANAFKVFEKEPEEGCVEIFDQDLGWYFAESFFCKMQKQTEAIAISGYRVGARSPLAKQTISKEGLKKSGKRGRDHRCSSRSINRSVAN
jgi:hypothetical protein